MRDERLAALVDLQEVITEKYTLYRNHEAIPERLSQLRDQIAEAEKKLASTEKELKETQQRVTRSQRELQTTQEGLQSVQAKLNQVKTTREYESRQKEIKHQRERLVELEKAIVDGQERIPSLEEDVEAAKAHLSDVRERLKPEIKELEGESKIFEKGLESIVGREREKRERVPSEILERIDKLVLLRGGLAVVAVQDGCCGGCGIQLSPQMIQVAKRGLDLMQCDRCSSYLYWEGDDD